MAYSGSGELGSAGSGGGGGGLQPPGTGGVDGSGLELSIFGLSVSGTAVLMAVPALILIVIVVIFVVASLVTLKARYSKNKVKVLRPGGRVRVRRRPSVEW